MGIKRSRKKPRPPQAISPETWKAVEAAICIGGLGLQRMWPQVQCLASRDHNEGKTPWMGRAFQNRRAHESVTSPLQGV